MSKIFPLVSTSALRVEISEGQDERLEAARLAPSGMNAQGWFFSAIEGKIHCYRKKSILKSEMMSHIDMGIAIFHIALESETFSFTKEANTQNRKGFIYTGTVQA